MEFVRPLEPILIIDDAVEIRDFLTQILENLGFEEVYGCEDFDSAKPLLKHKQPSVVFLDIELPDGDGKELIATLNEINPNINVVMVSAHSTVDNVKDAIERGAKGFVVKPGHRQKPKCLACKKNT